MSYLFNIWIMIYRCHNKQCGYRAEAKIKDLVKICEGKPNCLRCGGKMSNEITREVGYADFVGGV